MVDLLNESLNGRTVIVMGVGPGQGMSTVRMFLNFGAKVAIVNRSGSSFGLTESDNIKVYKCDATDEAAVIRLKKEILDDFGVINSVVSNTGIWEPVTGTFGSLHELERNFKVNVEAHVIAINVFSETMKEEGGTIVLVGASRLIYKGNTMPYSVSKSSVEELTRIAAEKLRQYNIRVNAVAPGSVLGEDTYFNVFPFSYPRLAERIVVEPIEVAMTTVFLSSNMSSGIDGQCITVDRGLNAI